MTSGPDRAGSLGRDGVIPSSAGVGTANGPVETRAAGRERSLPLTPRTTLGGGSAARVGGAAGWNVCGMY
jgi:hypothetical protein